MAPEPPTQHQQGKEVTQAPENAGQATMPGQNTPGHSPDRKALQTLVSRTACLKMHGKNCGLNSLAAQILTLLKCLLFRAADQRKKRLYGDIHAKVVHALFLPSSKNHWP